MCTTAVPGAPVGCVELSAVVPHLSPSPQDQAHRPRQLGRSTQLPVLQVQVHRQPGHHELILIKIQ